MASVPGLKGIVNKRILEDVIGAVTKDKDWVVLVVDHESMRIISACCRMQDIMGRGVTLVEDISKSREPLRAFEAIYLLSPKDESIQGLMDDFKDLSNPQYKAAHVFFTESLPEALFHKLAKSETPKVMKTLKEMGIAFLPAEQLAFSLDRPDVFKTFFTPDRVQGRSQKLETIAEQIATLCSTLGEYPSVRYRHEFPRMGELAEMVQRHLNRYKLDNQSLGSEPGMKKSQLIILDRGFDPVSPILHELTLQAMAYDLLNVKNDVFKYEFTSSNDELASKEVILDETDDLWVTLRHLHIADVMKKVSNEMKTFLQEKKVTKRGADSNVSLRELSKMMKRIPQYQKELSKYQLHMHLAESCWQKYKDQIDELCKVEQDLAMGSDSQGEKVKDAMKLIIPILLKPEIKVEDKLRILLLFILNRNGISDENLQKLVKHAQIPHDEIATILNMQHLGVPVVVEEKKKKTGPERRERPGLETYSVSRWIPVIKDIMEDCVEGKLKDKVYPFVSGTAATQQHDVGGSGEPTSARWNWRKEPEKAQGPRSGGGPRLIIFIVGGVTYSEVRCAYEVTKAQTKEKWEVIVGSNGFLTPNDYLKGLKNLDKKE
ncbi:syntaxin-binding protein 1-like [Oscarella lobularis]|uniref:syntaxin-binding protein 1-like n=1 Tax=Oscarella lobularis TaxID=121494 RepID=UPI0033138199